MACPFYGRHRETHADADFGDTVGHMAENNITFSVGGEPVSTQISGKKGKWWRNDDLDISINNRHFIAGKASGAGFNCLIDTLIQCCHLQGHVVAPTVRSYIDAKYPSFQGAFLELETHWADVLNLIHANITDPRVAHTTGEGQVCDRYKTVCVDVELMGNGDVVGTGSNTLYMARVGGNHFVPLIPKQNSGSTVEETGVQPSPSHDDVGSVGESGAQSSDQKWTSKVQHTNRHAKLATSNSESYTGASERVSEMDDHHTEACTGASERVSVCDKFTT